MSNTFVAKKAYDVTVKGVKINPDPVVRGKPATFSISATTGTLWSEKVDHWFQGVKSFGFFIACLVLLISSLMSVFLSKRKLIVDVVFIAGKSSL